MKSRECMEEDLPHYSDANFTMRLSYGQVKDLVVGGKPAGYYTTSESIVEKMNTGDKEAEEKFKQAAQAYDVLRDPDKRARYDQFGAAGVDGAAGGFGGFGAGGMDLNDIFRNFGDIFGGAFGGFGGFGGGRGQRHLLRFL